MKAEVDPTRPARAAVYSQVFWLAYIANTSLVTGNALTFRFAELIAWLGGTEQTAGTIVSAGMFGALLLRLVLGQAIDHYGTRRLWLVSAASFVAGCCLFVVPRTIGWDMYAGRILFASGLAGMFTCSIVHIQNQVPANRRTEVIASLGSSGFLGMILGTQIGDFIFSTLPAGEARFHALFGGATTLGLVYLVLVAVLTRSDAHHRPHDSHGLHRLMFRYWPGNVVLVAMMMGIGFTVTSVFLTRFTTWLGLSGIGTFWTVYAVSAFIVRVGTRNWGRTVGRHRMIQLGLVSHCIGHWGLIFVSNDWHLAGPAVICGFGHALLFPAVVSLGSGAFPPRFRGTGTTLTLGFVDLGAALFAPVLGGIIDRFNGGNGFAQMFFVSGATSLAIGVIYSVTTARGFDDERENSVRTSVESGPAIDRSTITDTTDAVAHPVDRTVGPVTTRVANTLCRAIDDAP